MNSRGPLSLLVVAMSILLAGMLVHVPFFAPAIQPILKQGWPLPAFVSAIAIAAIFLAWDWHRSLASAKAEGELAHQREFEQRNIAQQRLTERQQWHRAVFDNNYLAMLLIDPESGRIVDANVAAVDFYGYSRAELLSKTIFEVNAHPRDEVLARLARAKLMGTAHFTVQHRVADGSLRHISLITGPILTEGRTLLFSIIQDISPQMRAEETVRRIVDSSPLGFHMYRLEGERLIFTGYNRAAEEILNTSHQDFIGKTIEEVFPMPEMQPVAKCYREIAQNGGRWTLENFAYAGRSMSGILDVNAFQIAPGSVVAMFADATERYRQEELLARSERRFRMLYERSPVGIAIIHPQTLQIVSVNRALQQIFGWDEASLLDRRFDQLPSPEPGEVLPIGPESFGSGQAQTFQHRYLRRDGGFVWVDVTLSAIPGEQGDVNLGLAIIQDITQRRRADEQLRQAMLAAERANAAKDQFLAALSHELRTPLTPVLLTTQALQMDSGLPQSIREELTVIQRNVELEARLIDDLLDLTRIARGKLRLHTAPMNLHECLRHAIEVCRPEAVKKEITIELWLDAGRSMVIADTSRMQQVFWNLLKNAIKFTPANGLVVIRTHNDPTTATADEPARIICEVADNGVGMDAETLSRIFLPFEQGSAQITKLFGGLGMGLAISKAIIDLHHGQIDAYSAGPGSGAVFTVTLNTADVTSEPEPVTITPEQPPVEHPLTVLLVEDHEATARILSLLLVRCGYRVLTAGDIASAIQLAAESEFDLLISDLGLPDGSGLDLLPRIRAFRTTPAIAVSGYGMDQDIRNSLAAGFQEHLIKPVNLDRLRQAIARATAKEVSV